MLKKLGFILFLGFVLFNINGLTVQARGNSEAFDVMNQVLLNDWQDYNFEYKKVLIEKVDKTYQYEKQCTYDKSFQTEEDCQGECVSPKRCVARDDSCFYCLADPKITVLRANPPLPPQKPGLIVRWWNGGKKLIKNFGKAIQKLWKNKKEIAQEEQTRLAQEKAEEQAKWKENKDNLVKRLLAYFENMRKQGRDVSKENDLVKEFADLIAGVENVADLHRLNAFVQLYCGKTSDKGVENPQCKKLLKAIKKQGDKLKEEMYAKLQMKELSPDTIKELIYFVALLQAGEGKYGLFSDDNIAYISDLVHKKALKILKKQAKGLANLGELQNLFNLLYSDLPSRSSMMIFGSSEGQNQALQVLNHRARRMAMKALLGMDICDPDPQKLANLNNQLNKAPGCKKLLAMPDVCQALADGDTHKAYNLLYEHTKDNPENKEKLEGPVDCDGKKNSKYTPQTYEDAESKLKNAIAKGDDDEVARLREVLIRRLLERMAYAGFNDLFNLNKEIRKWCTYLAYKDSFTKEACEKMRKALLKRGDAIKDELLKNFDPSKLLAIEIHMIIVELKSGQARYLDGKLREGYFSEENVKKALKIIEEKIKVYDAKNRKTQSSGEVEAEVGEDVEKIEENLEPEEVLNIEEPVEETVTTDNENIESEVSEDETEVENIIIEPESEEEEEVEETVEDTEPEEATTEPEETVIEVEGCMDPLAPNYDSEATIDNGSCIAPIFGCTDSSALNYMSEANSDDGSCLYEETTAEPNSEVEGCMDPLAPNYDSEATIDNGSCIAPIFGCTDSSALNYMPEANSDDGSCLYEETTAEPNSEVEGCMDPLAPNYDSEATIDNGSCIAPIFGCTDSSALNYMPEANSDDGSCLYE